MTTEDVAKLNGFELAVAASNRNVEKIYCADLLSWAMGKAPENSAWCTVMGNINAVAVASLADVAVIVLCEGAVLDKDAKEKAEKQDVNIIRTELPAFEAGCAIAKEMEKR